MDLFPHVNSRVYLEGFGDIPLLTFSATPHDELRLFVKRLIDVLASAAALVCSSHSDGSLGSAGAADIQGTSHFSPRALRTQWPALRLL